MYERIVAYGGQTGYAQGRGEFAMPSSEPRETPRPNIEKPHGEPRAEATGRAQRTQNKNLLEDSSTFLGRINNIFEAKWGPIILQDKPDRDSAKHEAPVEERKKPEVSFSEAHRFSSDINRLRDTDKKTKAKIPDVDITGMRGLLRKMELEDEVVGGMTDEEVIAATQLALPRVRVLEPEESDFAYEKDEDKKAAEKVLAREKIEKARDIENEEILTPDLVKERLKVEEFSKKKIEGGSGTMTDEETEAAIELPELREVIARLKYFEREKLSGNVLTADQNEQYEKYRQDLEIWMRVFDDAYVNKHFRQVFEIVKAIEDAEYTSKKYEPKLRSGRPATDILDAVMSPALRKNREELRDKLDKEFQDKYNSMDNRVRDILMKDLELKVGTELYSILNGWHDIEEVKAMIFGGPARTGSIEGIVKRYEAEEHYHQAEGIREWRATRSLYGAEERVSIELLTRPPARWQEVPERVSQIYRLVERSDYSVEQLQESIRKVVQMIESIQTDDKQGRDVLEQLTDELGAFQAFHSYRITTEDASMSPEAAMRVFERNFDDETWVNFAKRFGTYSRVNEKGERLKFERSGGRDINLLDEQLRLYFKQMQEDRKVMNLVEALTVVGIDHNLTDKDYKDIEKFFDRTKRPLQAWEKAKLEELRTNFISRLADKKYSLSPDAWGKDITKTEGVINDWYAEETLLGAHGRGKDGKERLESRRELMRDQLLNLLKRDGLKVAGDARSTADLLEELNNQGFLEAVDLNAYNLAWTLGWSDFDLIRIYGKDWKTGKQRDVPQAIAFNQDTNLFYGRHIDHMLDFTVNEQRGRSYEATETNAILRKHMLGAHGNLLPQNRIMVRFAGFFLEDNELVKQEIDRRVREMMKKSDFVPSERYRKMLDQPISGEYEDPYMKAFYGWAKSAVIAEMIDSGDTSVLSFDKADFSKTVAPKIRKFEMVDLYGDRNAALKYFSRENLQAYLRDPSNERFLKINDQDSVFYSGRDPRLWGWMKIAYEAHWEIAHYNWKKLFNRDNLQSGGADELVETMKEKGLVKKEQGDFLMHETLGIGKGILGTVPFRRLRQAMDTLGYTAWESKTLPISVLWAMLLEFIKRLGSYIASGK